MRQQSGVISTILLMILLPSAAWSQSNTASVEEIIKAVEQYPQQLQSARMEGIEINRTTADFSRVNQSQGQPETTKQHIIWAFKGEKRYKQYTESFDPKEQKTLHKLVALERTEIFDGQDQYTLLGSELTGLKDKRVQGNIEHANRTDILPLRFGHQVGGKWLVDVLRSGDYEFKGTMNDPQFALLYQFSASTGTNEQTRFWLAPKYGFIAVRTELESKVGSRHPLLVHQLKRAEQRHSIWFPTAGTMEFFEIEGGKKTLLSERQFSVSRFELNNVPDNLFKPNLRPGYAMKDGATNQVWRIGPNGEKIFIDMSNTGQSRSMPIGWLFMASLTTLLVLGMGALLWRRRRHRTASS